MTSAASSPIVRLIQAVSSRVLAAEHAAIKVLMTALCILVLLNVATRYAGMPIYWVDESAVYSVVWLTFIGGSAMTRMRLDFAMTLLTDYLPPAAVAVARVIATLFVLSFGILLAWMCWNWMDPLGIAAAGFDPREYAGRTFNFLYTERTQTLNWPTWVLYLVIPLFAVTMSIHALANLLEDLGLAPPIKLPQFAAAQAEGVVN